MSSPESVAITVSVISGIILLMVGGLVWFIAVLGQHPKPESPEQESLDRKKFWMNLMLMFGGILLGIGILGRITLHFLGDDGPPEEHDLARHYRQKREVKEAADRAAEAKEEEDYKKQWETELKPYGYYAQLPVIEEVIATEDASEELYDDPEPSVVEYHEDEEKEYMLPGTETQGAI